MRHRFTEQDTEAFYDAEDALYRSFWDEAGSLHWGYFDDTTGEDFLKACANLNKVMAAEAGIDELKVMTRRHMTTSQRAMVAAKIAGMKRGENQHAQKRAPSQDEAARESAA